MNQKILDEKDTKRTRNIKGVVKLHVIKSISCRAGNVPHVYQNITVGGEIIFANGS